MNHKIGRTSFLVGLLIVSLSIATAYAGHGKGYGGGGQEGQGLEHKFKMKAHFMMENAQELGLTDDKVEEIRKLKFETKKALVRQNAEIEVLGLDIMEKLHQDAIDVEAVNKLVDQKYELEKAQAKSLVGVLAKLKSQLSPEQAVKMRELWKSGSKHEEGWESHREGSRTRGR